MNQIKKLLKTKKNKAIAGVLVMIVVSVIGIYYVNQQKKASELARQSDVLKSVEIIQLQTELEYGQEYLVYDLFETKNTYGVTIEVDNYDISLNEEATARFIGLGDQVILFTLSYMDSSDTRELTYEVRDTQFPVIDGVKDYEITVGDSLDYKSLIKATDKIEGDLEVSYSGDVDLTKVGTYSVKATATDINGNTSDKEFKIVVKDKEVVQAETPTVQNKPSTSNSNKSSSNTSNSSSSNSSNKNNNTSSGGGTSSNKPSTNTESTCKPLVWNSGKVFDSEEEATEWADNYMFDNIKTIRGWAMISSCGNTKFTIEFEYRD